MVYASLNKNKANKESKPDARYEKLSANSLVPTLPIIIYSTNIKLEMTNMLNPNTKEFNNRFSLRVLAITAPDGNISIQFTQAIICVVFITFVSNFFSQIGLVLYLFGGLYILYLSYKAFISKQTNTTFELSFLNLATVM